MPSAHVHLGHGDEAGSGILLCPKGEEEVGVGEEICDALEHGPRFEDEGGKCDLNSRGSRKEPVHV